MPELPEGWRDSDQWGVICPYCKGPIKAGDAVYSINQSHWDCEYPEGYESPLAKFEKAKTRIESSLASLGVKPKVERVREGEGYQARLAQAKVMAYIQTLYPTAKIGDTHFWHQQGAYRGMYWDLARWGGFFTLHFPDHENPIKACFHSWDTVASAARAHSFVHTRESAWDHDISPNPRRDLPMTEFCGTHCKDRTLKELQARKAELELRERTKGKLSVGLYKEMTRIAQHIAMKEAANVSLTPELPQLLPDGEQLPSGRSDPSE